MIHNPDRQYIFRMTWPITVIVFGMIIIGAAYNLFGPSRPTRSTVTQALRGNNLLIVRIPTTQAEGDELTVYTDRLAVRGPIMPSRNHTSTQVTLSSQDWDALVQLRDTWCRAAPVVTTKALEPDVYEIGLACSAFRQKAVSMPRDQLPAALQVLIQLVPAPSA